MLSCVSADQSFLVFVRRNEIRGVDLENANFSVIPTLTTPYVSNPIAVDYDISDEREGHLYWADQELKVINKSPLSGSDVKTIIDSGLKIHPSSYMVADHKTCFTFSGSCLVKITTIN